MFRKRAFKLADWLAEVLFAALVLVALWKYRSNYLPILGAGLAYFCIAASLPLLSTSRAQRKRKRENRILLATAYLILIISVLNFLSGNMNLRGARAETSVSWVILLSLLYAFVEVLLVTLAFWDEDFRLPLSQDARKLFSATVLAAGVSWIFALALAGGGLLEAKSLALESHNVHLNLYILAVVFAALFSGMLGYVLTRSMGLPFLHRRGAFAILCGLLLATGLNEYFVRGNWLLFSLSSVAFIGAFFSAWEALAFVSGRSGPADRQIEEQAGD